MPPSARHEAGHPIRVEFTKWGGRPHWSFDGIYLGADEHGDWLGHRAGTLMVRPGRELTADLPWVSLIPHHDAAHVVTYQSAGHAIEIYVDITTPPEWHDDTLRAVDLDLDVIRFRDDRGLVLDDEDEFEAHQLQYGYPPEIITLAEESAERVLAAVGAHEPPYDQTGQRWLAEHAALLG